MMETDDKIYVVDAVMKHDSISQMALQILMETGRVHGSEECPNMNQHIATMTFKLIQLISRFESTRTTYPGNYLVGDVLERSLKLLRGGNSETLKCLFDGDSIQWIYGFLHDTFFKPDFAPFASSVGGCQRFISCHLEILKIISSVNNDWLRNFRTTNGGNLLMKVVEELNLEKLPPCPMEFAPEFVSWHGINKVSTCFPLFALCKFLLRKVGIDPNQKDFVGRCFSDYIPPSVF